MTNDLGRLEDAHKVQKLLEPKPGDLPNEGVHASRAEVPEGAVECKAASATVELFGNGAALRARRMVELFASESDFRVDAVGENKFKITGQMPPRHVDLNYLQDFSVFCAKLESFHCRLPPQGDFSLRVVKK
jgi:hypothetical protein